MSKRPRSHHPAASDRSRSLGFDRIRIEDESTRDPDSTVPTLERVLLVGICLPKQPVSLAREHLEELDMLARTAGAEVADRDLVMLRRIDSATFIGKGKVEELMEIADDARADLIVFDEDLAPAQTRNLEQKMGRRILERSGLILDIFARRAQSREARTQVELAQLRYMLPRLSGAWTHLERQKGGIGLRGPGETQIETDRRIIRARVRQLEDDLKHIEKSQTTQRRNRAGTYRFALAGYTNVGKSTLMNALTGAGVYEEDLLFATLDSTTRNLQLGSRQNVLISDTVGFIRKLPPDLVASFRSTLAEIREANCILHVIDLASPFVQDQMSEVDKLFAEMKLNEIPMIQIFNKVDAVDDRRVLGWVREAYPDAVLISAKRRIGIDKLEATLKSKVEEAQKIYRIQMSAENGQLIAQLHQFGEVLETRPEGTTLRIKVRMMEADANRLGISGKS